MAIEHDLIHTISIKVAPALSHWDPPGCLNLQQMVVRGFASKKERECAFQSVHQLFQAPVHTFLCDITQRHHYCCSIHPNNVKSMCQVQAQCWGIFVPTCQHQPHEDCSLVFRDISIIITQYQETRFALDNWLQMGIDSPN